MKNLYRVIILSLLSCIALDARDQSSTVKVSGNAKVVTKNLINGFGGTLEVEDFDSVEGEEITFSGGAIKHQNRKTKITGKLGVLGILLDGVKRLRGDGLRMDKSLFISGPGNILEGELLLKDDVVLGDIDSNVAFAVTRRIDKNIILNGGSLDLDEDLRLLVNKKIIGPGVVRCHNQRLSIGTHGSRWDTPLRFDDLSAIELDDNMELAETWTFVGQTNRLFGNGRTLYLHDNANIVIGAGASLMLSNIILDGVSGNNIRCLDNDATITFNNVVMILDGNYRFPLGGMNIISMLDLQGSYTFVYQTAMTTTITKKSTLYLESALTFSYDPLSPRNDLLIFKDSSSVLFCDGANVHVTHTGLHLRNGTLMLGKNNKFYAEMLISDTTGLPARGGITLGNSNTNEDMICTILGGSSLEIAQGDLIYKNVNKSSLNFLNDAATLKMNLGTRLLLDETMNIGNGIVQLHTDASLIRAEEKRLIGSVHMFK